MDWYESYANLAGERTKLNVFALRSMASGAAFHGAFSNARSRPSWKLTSWLLRGLAGSFNSYGTILFPGTKSYNQSYWNK